MSKVFLFTMVVGIGSFLTADWESIGPYGGPLGVVATAPSDENIVYVAGYREPAYVFRSTDGGATWSKRSILSDQLFCLAVDPANPLILYAGSKQSVYKSIDGGATWSCDSIPGNNNNVNGLAVDPTSPSIIFAVGRTLSGSYSVMAFFKSTNGGNTWSTTALHTVYNGDAYCMVLDLSNPDNIYVGGYYRNTLNYPKVYKSTNGGSNFTDMSSGFNTNGNYIKALAVHPSDLNIVYAATFYDGIYRTTDGGTLWSMVKNDNFITCLATTQTEPNNVYAGKDTVIYKSTDAGVSWFTTGSGHGGVYKMSRGLAACQNQVSTLYTVDNLGVFKTTNGGTNWFDANQDITTATILAIGIAPTVPSTMYTEFEDAGVFKTTNSGTLWQQLSTPLDCGAICEFAVHNANPDIVYGLEGFG